MPRLDLPTQDCENRCFIGIYGMGTAGELGIARLPRLRRGPGTFDVLIDVFVPCDAVVQPTTLRMRNAITYVDCTGDCDADGDTTIDELVLGVKLVLEEESTGRCPSYDEDDDGAVSIAELVRAVRNTLEGCGD